MRLLSVPVFIMAVALSGAAIAQDAAQGPPPTGDQGAESGMGRPGRGGWGRGMGMGNGVSGTVTEVTSEHFTVKSLTGETWTIHYSANTRMAKQPPRPAGETTQQQGPMTAYVPSPIKASDVKVGDTIMAAGQVDQGARSVGAVGVMVIDPERAKQMQAMQANYGKTWLMGRVTAIEETKVTIEGGMDHAVHTFVADENTSFRKRREPVTLADVQVGDGVRVEGALKDGQFVATTVNVMVPQAMGGPARREGPPPQKY